MRQETGGLWRVRMNVTMEQAIEIYAKAMISWFAGAAAEKAEERGKELVRLNDLEGAWAWSEVKLAVVQIQASLPVRVGRRNRMRQISV
jgi:hypothetical protein